MYIISVCIYLFSVHIWYCKYDVSCIKEVVGHVVWWKSKGHMVWLHIVIIRKRADVCNMLDTKNDIYPASG